MVFVILGTQDKDFSRLLKAVDKAIDDGYIKDRVVVQAGSTKYTSDNMEIFDLLPAPEFDKMMDDADLIITHGGVGTILTAIKKNKKIIAASRLAKYREHHNDHQKQIIKEFADKGYLLELRDFNKLGKLIEKSKNFKQKKFESNTENMIKLLENYIEDSNHISWLNKYREGIFYLFFGGCTTLINIISFYLFRKIKIGLQVSNVFAWIISVLFAFITNKLYVFQSVGRDKGKTISELLSFVLFRVVSLVFDIGFMHLLVNILSVNEMISKIISNVFVIIINYVFSKLFIFKK